MPIGAANLELLDATARALGALRDEVVFVGGATTALLITDPGSADLRVTKDVDVIVETATRADYYRFSERLRTQGFRESPEGPICRWLNGPLVLDVMPTDEAVLGFSNRWYHDAIVNAVPYTLPSSGTVQHLTAPYFLATKLAAFDGRGGGDYLGSQDLEDIVALVNGRSELVAEVSTADPAMRRYIGERLQAHMGIPGDLWRQSVMGHLGADRELPGRIERAQESFRRLAAVR